MAVPFDPTDPSYLTPDQRLEELAAILAAGVRRVRALRPVSLPETQPDSVRNGLDPSAEQSVYAPRG